MRRLSFLARFTTLKIPGTPPPPHTLFSKLFYVVATKFFNSTYYFNQRFVRFVVGTRTDVLQRQIVSGVLPWYPYYSAGNDVAPGGKSQSGFQHGCCEEVSLSSLLARILFLIFLFYAICHALEERL